MNIISKISFIVSSVFFYVTGKYFVKYLYRDKRVFKSKYYENWLSTSWKDLFLCFFFQKILRINSHVGWPVDFHVKVSSNPENIQFNPEDMHNFFSPGVYFQALGGKIIIGDGCYIGPNVGLITQNHDLNNLVLPGKKGDVILGKNCWIGMNSVLLPGVVLGEHTIVAAGSVVTKSYINGSCVIAGNPAKVIKVICN